LTAAGFTAVKAAGASVLFLRLLSSKQTIAARERVHNAIDEAFFHLQRGRLPKVLPAVSGHEVQVVDGRGQVISATPGMRGRPRMATFVPARRQVHAQRTLSLPGSLPGQPARRMNVLAAHIIPQAHHRRHGRGPLLIYAAAPTIPWYGSRRAVLVATGASTLATALAFVLTHRSTVKTLTPVEQVRREFAEITATDLTRRVPVPEHQEFRAMVQMLNTTLGRLEATFNDLRQFAAEVSHDLRSPLTGIRITLEDALAHPDEVDWPDVATEALVAVDHQQELVNDLLTLTRLDAGQPLRMERIDLGRLIATELRHRPPGRVTVYRDLHEQVMVKGDPIVISRILTNLLDNAQRHATTQVTVTVTAQGSVAVLDVADDGDGIQPQQREKVFERFVRLKASRDRDPNGTGLGLPICRQIAEAHHGTLTFEPDPDHGAHFLLRLPLVNGS
jgi:signal transduction histidine kinase